MTTATLSFFRTFLYFVDLKGSFHPHKDIHHQNQTQQAQPQVVRIFLLGWTEELFRWNSGMFKCEDVIIAWCLN
jgi:hypothetical protein